MSEILDGVGAVLQAAGVGTLGTNLFLSRQPDTPDACVTVVESGAGVNIYTHGVIGNALTMTNIQVTARAAREDYQSARSTITSVISALEAVAETTASSVRLLRVESLGRPIPMGYDGNDRPEIAMNFTVTHA
jgi:hypothetical protein